MPLAFKTRTGGKLHILSINNVYNNISSCSKVLIKWSGLNANAEPICSWKPFMASIHVQEWPPKFKSKSEKELTSIEIKSK